MGIPSYFSYIIKNHKYIISKFNAEYQISNFYIDSNSIIYEMIRTNEYDENKYESLLSYQNFFQHHQQFYYQKARTLLIFQGFF